MILDAGCFSTYSQVSASNVTSGSDASNAQAIAAFGQFRHCDNNCSGDQVFGNEPYKVYGNWTAFGGVGWMKYGSSPYIQLKNGFNANIGLGYKLSHDDDVGVYYDYRQKIATNGGPQSEVTAYWNHKLNQNLRLQAYVLGGFANGSPDYGVGASVKYLF